ncbi:MAG: LytTR family transcriptional regulator [Flavobacteriales bacterium]|nr:LytTR family transcriptional regulator [Flavobacteriales bacterium]
MLKLKGHNEDHFLQKKVAELERLLDHAKEKLQKESEYSKQLEAILQENSHVRRSNVITIKSATKIEFVHVDEIVCCQADEAYTHIELMNGKTITAAKPLTTFQQLLEPYPFFRISRSHLIHTGHIVTFFKDRNQILLKGDILLDVARRRRVEFLKMLQE